MLRRYIIEREVPGIGGLSEQELCGAAAKSNDALNKLAPKVQWKESYVASDRTFCVYFAENEEAVRKHAELSGFPANRIIEVPIMLDPTSANSK